MIIKSKQTTRIKKVVCPRCGYGFNGATAFQPWKLVHGAGNYQLTKLLQWGRGFSAVEIVIASEV